MKKHTNTQGRSGVHQKILIVESDATLRTTLARALSRRGYQIVTTHSKKEAYTLTQTDKPLDLALIDLSLTDGDGMELIYDLKSTNPDLKVILLTHCKEQPSQIAGVSHIIKKPFQTKEVIQTINHLFSPPPIDNYKFENIIGQSPEIKKVLEFIERVSESNSTTLIVGESGTGKELIAKAIHFNSPRSKAPFIPVNCGAIPSELLESELFGHIKGAFTNAISNRVGRFELAENGTIFFDEIGDMSPSLQVKLLRVLQERRFEPIGSTKTIESNVRVITATNIHLEKAVEKGQFREDLYYRLNVIPINVPPLRQRQGDIPILLQHFIETFNRGRSKKITGVSPEALNTLIQYDWPGNIRELKNLVERLTILKGEDLIELDDLPPNYNSQTFTPLPINSVEIPDTGMDFNSAVDAYENILIMKALERTGWNRNQAAILLKLNRTTLVEKIKKKGLRPPAKEVP